MLAKRIIPSILHKNGKLVKGKAFKNERVIGVALQSARVYAARDVDELLILDVSATCEGREPNYFMIKSLCNNCFSPVTVGGGITKDEHIRGLLCSGADKVCLGSVAKDRPRFVEDMAARYGSSTIVVSLDVRNQSILKARKEALMYQVMGAGELLLQSVNRDGGMNGYDLELIEEITNWVDIPVIASGGCGNYGHMLEAIDSGADAVAAGALFAFTEATPKGAAEFLFNEGVEVRL